MEVANSLLDLIGNTPLVRLGRVGAELQCDLIAKLEMLNAGGSVKDRPAVAMIDAAERDGLLQPGGTIVEPTSGNTGVGLAIVAAQRGYQCIFVMSDKMSEEKVSLLRAYGAEVVVCPTAVPPEHPDSYYSVADRLTRETPGAFRPDQYSNPANPAEHERSTGPEIWRQTDGRVTHFVAGIGTGGTITGVARYLKSQNPDVQIIGADPEGSVFSGGSGRPYLVEGVGEDFWPTTFDPSLVDRTVMVTDAESFAAARRVTREEGILIGGSCGTAVHAALVVGRELGPDDVVVVLLPDSGRNYLSKIFDDNWMIRYGFLRMEGTTAGDVLAAKDDSIPDLVVITPDVATRDAFSRMRELGVSQLVVATTTDLPLAAKEVSGMLSELPLMDKAFHAPDLLDRPVVDVMEPAPPMLGRGRARVRRRRPARALHRGAGARRRPPGGHPHQPGRAHVPRRAGAAMTEGTTGSRPAPSTPGRTPTPRPARWCPRSTCRRRSRSARSANTPGSSTRAAATPRAPRTKRASRRSKAPRAASRSRAAWRRRTRCCGCSHPATACSSRTTRTAAPSAWSRGARARRAWSTRLPISPTSTRSRARWQDGTTMVWIETPTNPALTVVDIAAVAELAHARGARVVVDNTFATPYLQRPLELGADIVVHSATKYLGGHSDVVGGCAVTSDAEVAERIGFLQNATGAVPSPFDCYLVLRGIKTLAVRMERHCANAQAVATMLVGHPAVSRVLYPGLADHPGHDIAARQMRDFGGMVSFLAAGGEDAALDVVAKTRLFTLAESLGGVESLIEHPTRMTHASVEGSELAVDPALVRLSVGIETTADLVADLRAALDSVG